jgi:hypothetical protein
MPRVSLPAATLAGSTVRQYILTLTDMSPTEFANYIANKDAQYGIEGYRVKGTWDLDKPLVPKWQKTKRPNFLDEVVKRMTRNSNDKFYEVSKSLIIPFKKTALYKMDRPMMLAEITNNEKKRGVPGPDKYSPSFTQLEQRVTGTMKLNEDRTLSGFMGEPLYLGAISPNYHDKNYSRVDPKIRSPSFKPSQASANSKLPGFMFGIKSETAKLHPGQYDALGAFRKTQEHGGKIQFLKGHRENGGSIHAALSTQKAKVAPNTYDPAKLDIAYKKTTRGFAKGWK